MLTSTLLVLMMSIPGLALFYGGLVRTKNMLSVLTQVMAIVSMVGILWVLYGYSISLGDTGGMYLGGFGKVFLKSVDATTTSATFSNGVVIPEYAYMVFQMTFAMITPALIVGAFAERMKFSAVMLFVLLWVTFIYFPIAHWVWATPSPDDHRRRRQGSRCRSARKPTRRARSTRSSQARAGSTRARASANS